MPSGIWDAKEYEKLKAYDGEIIEQVLNGGHRLFDCHQNTGDLCAGWIGCHGAGNLLAVRLHEVDPSAFDYVSPVPLFASGAEAAEHGMRDIDAPSEAACRAIDKITDRRAGSDRPCQ